MAKTQANLDNIFKKTERGTATGSKKEIPATGRTVSVGVGLKESEVALLDEIAKELDVTRNAIMRYGLRYFLSQIQAGSLDMTKDVQEPELKKRLKMP
jgi:hypothetical protein